MGYLAFSSETQSTIVKIHGRLANAMNLSRLSILQNDFFRCSGVKKVWNMTTSTHSALPGKILMSKLPTSKLCNMPFYSHTK